MKTQSKKVKSFHAENGEWEKFQFNCKLLNLSQSDTINDLIKGWNIENKTAVNEVIMKGRNL
jgi:hypothetical protein